MFLDRLVWEVGWRGPTRSEDLQSQGVAAAKAPRQPGLGLLEEQSGITERLRGAGWGLRWRCVHGSARGVSAGPCVLSSVCPGNRNACSSGFQRPRLS